MHLGSTVMPPCSCQLNNTHSASGSQASRRSRVKQKRHLLLLFMFLEEVSGTSSGRIGLSDWWSEHMELVYGVRGQINNIVHSHQRKVLQAVHSALNKLFCNYELHNKVSLYLVYKSNFTDYYLFVCQTTAILRTSFSLVAGAVSSIVQHSTSDEFQKECKRILNVRVFVVMRTF